MTGAKVTTTETEKYASMNFLDNISFTTIKNFEGIQDAKITKET